MAHRLTRQAGVIELLATPVLRRVPFGALMPIVDGGTAGRRDHGRLLGLVHMAVRDLRRRHGAVVVVLDDAEWLDPWSADAVGQLVSTRSAVVVGTASAGVALPQGLRRLVDGGELTPVISTATGWSKP